MTYLGKIIGNCGSGIPRTGIGNCPKNEGKTVALMITAYDAQYPLDSEAFKAGLQGWVSAQGNQRMFPIKGIFENTRAGGEVQTSDLGFGGTMVTGLSAPNEMYRIEAGLCFYKEASRLNKRKVRVFRIDDEGFIFGTVKTVGDTDYFVGFEAITYAYPAKATDGSTFGYPYLGVWYSANNEKEYINANAFEIPSVPDGLIGIILEKGNATGTAKVVSTCGGDDYTSSYDWQPEMFVNLAGASPETVTINQDTGLLTFAPVASYRIKSASALEESDIYGLDGVEQMVDLA